MCLLLFMFLLEQFIYNRTVVVCHTNKVSEEDYGTGIVPGSVTSRFGSGSREVAVHVVLPQAPM